MSLRLSHTFEVLQVGFNWPCCTNHKGLLLGNQAVKEKPNILSSGGGGGRRRRGHDRGRVVVVVVVWSQSRLGTKVLPFLRSSENFIYFLLCSFRAYSFSALIDAISWAAGRASRL